MNEEYLVGLFRKALIEAKAENLVILGDYILHGGEMQMIKYRINDNEKAEFLLRDEKALRKLAKSVIEAAK